MKVTHLIPISYKNKPLHILRAAVIITKLNLGVTGLIAARGAKKTQLLLLTLLLICISFYTKRLIVMYAEEMFKLPVTLTSKRLRGSPS